MRADSLYAKREAFGLSPVPVRAGIGLKPEHYHGILRGSPDVGFFEVHTENYMGAGGPPHRYLEQIAADYPLSFHGVGLSLAGVGPLDREHLKRWRALVDRYGPTLVSEHVAWSSHDEIAFHDLLPIPYTEEALRVLCEHIDEMQNALGRRVLVENPSRYLDFRGADMSEPDFLIQAARGTGCGLLLDVNNVYVSTRNQGEDAAEYLAQIPPELVEEIHLAGHSVQTVAGEEIRIDDHGSHVSPAVWELYAGTIARMGPRPTLIEWDTAVPELDVLLAEARRADNAAAVAESTPEPTDERDAVAQ
jgi:hypothetical protein